MKPESSPPTTGNGVAKFNRNMRRIGLADIVYGSIIMALLMVIAGLYLTHQTWFTGRDDARTITIEGRASLTAEPDEYHFSPSYGVKNSDQATALAELSAKSDEIVEKVRGLGVPEKDIKTTASGYDFPIYYKQDPEDRTQYMLSLTITVRDKALAQKIQDYLITTEPVGTLTPHVVFSQTKSRELEDKARTDAIKDAKNKAEKMAKELGFKLKGVKSVNSGQPVQPPYGLAEKMPNAISSGGDASLTVQPGVNEYTYNFSVEYYIR